MFAAALEQIQDFAPPKRAAYVRIIVAGFAAIVLSKAFRFFGHGFWEAGQATDFAAFYIVAQKVWLGDVDLTYRFQSFVKMQAEASADATSFMPWTYPPQFDLLLSPLALLPGWAAYLSFTALTLGAYLATLRAIAEKNFALVLIVSFPAVAVTIGSGQNGFLTGILMGLACINIERRPFLAGIALGAMIIKPHLAIAAGVYMLLIRRWPVITAAGVTIILSSLVCTIVFTPSIWGAWLEGVRESASFLQEGRYPLFRMISTYAMLYAMGGSSAAAAWGQALAACLALGTLTLGVVRGPSPRFALGVAVLASVMISPYAYDYDLPIVGVALAMLLPDLSDLATLRERSLTYGLLAFAGGYGLLQTAFLAGSPSNNAERSLDASVSGAALLVVLMLVLHATLREARHRRLRDSAIVG
ncbi:glycosyltransferase family 87 protein [Bradyrhizobium sp. Cp5.3]|uniref:glycosyltransferase family 87 protein n=1 Tax=Bradyrhizobium sp. Cp5.3 TaxID=443598 RepID=UPI00041AA7EA|nr:glycosyltransferase family 87 protein [Bradyrhizobium sp. Cp5.3]